MTTRTKPLEQKEPINWKRLGFMFGGIALFLVVNYSPAWPDAVDPAGKHFILTQQGKAALAVFCLAGSWWVFEVLPIGVTSLVIGILQTLYSIRADTPKESAKIAFNDFMDPSVMFIFASIVIGLVFTKTGLTKRLAYKMLLVVGEKTSMILLGTFVMTAFLTHFMAHTAVAATIYPLLITIYALYDETGKKSNFGKALFIGMAYVAGAGSIITLLGAARGAVALGFYSQIVGKDISFFELSYYMFPIGWLMVFLLWGFFMVVLKPEKKVIPGLRNTVLKLTRELGPVTRKEVYAAVIVLALIVIMFLRSVVPSMASLDKTSVILITTVLFFMLGILDLHDLEEVPWNIILLFGGAMSIGFCLYQTKAAEWLAINWLMMFQDANWFVFLMGISFFVMIMTNFIMNVAAIAISLPVALVMAPYLGVAPEAIVFSALVVAGMPFLMLVGAAPNAIAATSGQFTSAEFFKWGTLASVLLMALTGLAVAAVWPVMGMPILLPVAP